MPSRIQRMGSYSEFGGNALMFASNTNYNISLLSSDSLPQFTSKLEVKFYPDILITLLTTTPSLTERFFISALSQILIQNKRMTSSSKIIQFPIQLLCPFTLRDIRNIL